MNKNIFLLIAVACIGIFIIPQTVAMFAGQHNFYDTALNSGIQVPCEKCHADISTELSQPGSVNYIHKAIGCVGCHIVTPSEQGQEFHTAAIPLCIDCHRKGGIGRDASKIFSANDSHQSFVNEANNSKLMKGTNEACIGCHTHVAVNITWNKYSTMNLVVNGNTEVTNISGSGTATFTTSG